MQMTRQMTPEDRKQIMETVEDRISKAINTQQAQLQTFEFADAVMFVTVIVHKTNTPKGE